MKYIKKFNESLSDLHQDLYQEISKEDFSELAFGNRGSYNRYLIWSKDNPIDWKDFSDNELDKIHKVSKSRLFLDSEQGWNYRVLGIGKYDGIKVIKLEDDWFLVEVDYARSTSGIGTNYKCDQIEGLLKFLKDFYESE